MTQAAENERSSLLSEDENQIVFTVIGQRKQTKATTVIQMFHAHPAPNQWSKFRTGVVCFVKDNSLKSYFIKLIDISARKVIFEQELYDQFSYKVDRPHFHSFPGDDFTVGLNFADPKEADKFKDAVESKIQYVRRSTIRRSKPPDQPNARGAPPSKVPTPAVNRPAATVSHSDPYSLGDNKKKPSAPQKGRKLTKADIGLPTDFKHLAHVGWDPNTGAFNSSNIQPEWKNLLDKVGVTEEQLQDKETAEFIYDFVEKNGGIQAASRQLEIDQNRRPPPPPSHRGAPPPPPPSRGGGRGPPPPPHRSAAPPPPPPSSRGGGGGGPPPPPPPPPIGGPAPPPPPPVSSGSKGGPPPPPPSNSKPSSNLSPVPIDDTRVDLLASIRNPGFKLKSVSDNPDVRASIAPSDDDALDGMAGALQRALQQRAKVIQPGESDDESDEEFDDDEEWEA